MSSDGEARSQDHFVWIDCEMTGLDPKKHVILEIATIITTGDLQVVGVGPELTIRPSEADLARMDEWSRDMHTKSGLLETARRQGLPMERAEEQTLAFIKQFCEENTAPLCGNSVGHDKVFLAACMPKIHEYLHYRIVDVTSIKILVEQWYGTKYRPPEKGESHRALADIRESIEELKYYKDNVFVP